MIRKFILAALLLCAPSVYAQGTISAMTAASALSGTELFECVQSGSKKCTATQIKTFTSASPTLVTPNLGTPSAGVATNLTGTASGLTAGTVTTNANLTGDVTSSGNATTLATVNSNVGSFTNSSITVNGKGLITAASSGAAGAVLTANSFTDTQTVTKGAIGATSTDGAVLQNTTAAAAGAQQWSPRLRLTGQGWKTTATAASQEVSWVAEVQPIQGSSAPTSQFQIRSSINGGAYGERLSFDSGGTKYNFNAAFSLWNGGSGALGIGSSSDQYLVVWGNTVASLSRYIGFSSSAGSVAAQTIVTNMDVILSRSAAATLQQGAANAASPVAQTLQAQGARSGTDTNVAGASYTIRPGAGTGTATPASLILATYVPVASGTGAQTSTAALTLSNSLTLGSHIVTPAGSGTRYLCIDTGGIVTSSASACSGT